MFAPPGRACVDRESHTRTAVSRSAELGSPTAHESRGPQLDDQTRLLLLANTQQSAHGLTKDRERCRFRTASATRLSDGRVAALRGRRMPTRRSDAKCRLCDRPARRLARDQSSRGNGAHGRSLLAIARARYASVTAGDSGRVPTHVLCIPDRTALPVVAQGRDPHDVEPEFCARPAQREPGTDPVGAR
jgi:hypothetical protein